MTRPRLWLWPWRRKLNGEIRHLIIAIAAAYDLPSDTALREAVATGRQYGVSRSAAVEVVAEARARQMLELAAEIDRLRSVIADDRNHWSSGLTEEEIKAVIAKSESCLPAPACVACLSGDIEHQATPACPETHTCWKNCGEDCCIGQPPEIP